MILPPAAMTAAPADGSGAVVAVAVASPSFFAKLPISDQDQQAQGQRAVHLGWRRRQHVRVLRNGGGTAARPGLTHFLAAKSARYASASS